MNLPENLPNNDFTPQENSPNTVGADPIGSEYLYAHEQLMYSIASQYMQKPLPNGNIDAKMKIEELFRQPNPFGIQEG
jgi:hypothetical protein